VAFFQDYLKLKGMYPVLSSTEIKIRSESHFIDARGKLFIKMTDCNM